jgi:hypothetical protein
MKSNRTAPGLKVLPEFGAALRELEGAVQQSVCFTELLERWMTWPDGGDVGPHLKVDFECGLVQLSDTVPRRLMAARDKLRESVKSSRTAEQSQAALSRALKGTK